MVSGTLYGMHCFSCDPIGQLCLTGPGYSGCTVMSCLINWIAVFCQVQNMEDIEIFKYLGTDFKFYHSEKRSWTIVLAFFWLTGLTGLHYCAFQKHLIILVDLLGNRSLLQQVQKFLVCDWWILICFVCFCVSGFVACIRNYDWQQWKTQL